MVVLPIQAFKKTKADKLKSAKKKTLGYLLCRRRFWCEFSKIYRKSENIKYQRNQELKKNKTKVIRL